MTFGGLWGPAYCPLRRFTGIPCPFCGTTTAATLVLRGRLGDALRVNPLGVIVVVVIVVVVLQSGWAVAQGNTVQRPVFRVDWNRRRAGVGGAILFVCWMIRLHTPPELIPR